MTQFEPRFDVELFISRFPYSDFGDVVRAFVGGWTGTRDTVIEMVAATRVAQGKSAGRQNGRRIVKTLLRYGFLTDKSGLLSFRRAFVPPDQKPIRRSLLRDV